MPRVSIGLLLLLGLGAMLLAACGGAAATATPMPTSTVAPVPTATPTPTLAPTNTPLLTESVPAEFADLAACLEERLGSDVARELVTGERRETAEEEAVLENCLLASASGVSSEAISPSVAACLEEGLGTGIVQVVGSGARQLTLEEEAVLVECLVASALALSGESASVTVESCLRERLGADIAAVVASRAIPLSETEQAALGECLLGTALSASSEPAVDGVTACLEERLGADTAAVVASGAIPY